MIRGINVSGQKRVKMELVKEAYETAGFGDVVTYIQSGNIVFTSEDSSKDSVASTVQEVLKKLLDLDVIVFMRDRNEFQAIVDGFPFEKEDTSKSHVTFLLAEPAEGSNHAIEELNKLKAEPEQFHVAATEIYLHCPNGYGRTKLSNNNIEKKLGVAATTRNWNTVTALLDMADRIA
jgi:uncharacterized protein (DUF1697 family)